MDKWRVKSELGIPMVCKEPTNHITDCYFCAIDLSGMNRKKRDSLKYPDVLSARRPVATVKKFQCLSSKNFLTLLKKMPQVLKNLKKKKWFLKMILHIHFPKRN
ncbi:Uncharacterized protein FKW44_008485 [Caligus rogercresseyi]|uniref:Uncharacterized protein n=1 Tax=Caligus rogercresseyi TaxID=217165 RepID=A0A7T8QUA9_CALRO|nr:Uncharacterized protein FKW44_008485 [Caligus rogercresseyi]